MRAFATSCSICPHHCGIDRRSTKRGVCRESDVVRLARASLHFWEEPPISAKAGSGTVFFSGCTLHCVYCQNAKIASGEIGREISIERLAEIFCELQGKHALNINLVTPTHFAPQIRLALDLARANGLKLPIVYNTSGYETVETIKAMRGYVDIYLTDFKYASCELAKRYSHSSDYPQVACDALDAMYACVGPYTLGDGINGQEGILQHGIIVRHLMLPGCLEDSKHVMDILAAKPYASRICVSLMNQYTPLPTLDVDHYPELNRYLSDSEYNELIDYALDLGLENSYMQQGSSADESFIPSFDYEGV